MPKLMIATGIFHPESGGPATYLKEILPDLQTHDWQVSVLTYGNNGDSDYGYPITRIKRQLLPLRLINYWRASGDLV